MNGIVKKVLSFLLVFTVCFGFFPHSASAESVTGFFPVDSLETGAYALVMSFSHVDYSYYLSHDPIGGTAYPGMDLPYYEDSSGEADLWKITKISSRKCTLQNEEKGENGYLNLSSSGSLGYGPRQEICYEFSGGSVKFFIDQDGARYYIRVTSQNVKRFHSGTGTSSNAFRLYKNVSYQATYSEMADAPLPEEEPLLTVACVSDIHTDWGFQNEPPYVRGSTAVALERIAAEEDADVLLVGGDNTSDNAGQSAWAWEYSVYENLMTEFAALASSIAPHHLWACGNHDHEAGEDEGYDSYAGYESLMTDSCGAPISVYRQKQDSTLTDQRYPEHILGLHYKIEGFDFIVLNPPYAKSQTYSQGTYQWLERRLQVIGSDKTVFLLTHYPLSGSATRTQYGISGSDYDRITGILSGYPQVIHLFGHDHGGSDSVFISEDTFERITSYNPVGGAEQDRNVVPVSFISSFMGSMSFSKISVTPNYLEDRDSDVVQALMIYVYRDRIVFQTKNYGSHPRYSNVVPLSWTIMRQVVAAQTQTPSVPESSGGGNSVPIGTDPTADKVSFESSEAHPSGSTVSSPEVTTDEQGSGNRVGLTLLAAIGILVAAGLSALCVMLILLYKKMNSKT